IEHLEGGFAGNLRKRMPVSHYFAHGLGGGLKIADKSESVLPRQICCCTGVFRDHGPAHGQKKCSAIAQPTRAPRNVDTFDRSEFSTGRRDIALITPRCSGDAMRINQAPTATSQTLTLWIMVMDVHGQFETRVSHSLRQIEIFFER